MAFLTEEQINEINNMLKSIQFSQALPSTKYLIGRIDWYVSRKYSIFLEMSVIRNKLEGELASFVICFPGVTFENALDPTIVYSTAPEFETIVECVNKLNRWLIEIHKYYDTNFNITYVTKDRLKMQREKISYPNQSLGDVGAVFIADQMCLNSVTSVELYGNKIGIEGAKAMAVALERNSNITSLDLSINMIGVEGLKYIISALLKNPRKIRLCLGGNDLGNEGAKVIASALEKGLMVENLRLSSNGIGEVGIVAIAEALKKNSSVKTLCLIGNSLNNTGLIAIAGALDINTSITTLEIGKNRYFNSSIQDTIRERVKRNADADAVKMRQVPKPN